MVLAHMVHEFIFLGCGQAAVEHVDGVLIDQAAGNLEIYGFQPGESLVRIGEKFIQFPDAVDI